ncbi:hypothetical protein CPB85DRAFT_203349 [Mucidula mucida]|nr:hypothetical protein CPB85DRAFT_203349 [Mucidula mucida]
MVSLQVYLAVGSSIGYLLLVKALRWKRYNDVHKRYLHKHRQGTLTPEDAQVIVHLAMTWDMPTLMQYSLEFALFKTFGVPTISQILADTKQMCGPMATKRYMDTKILIASWTLCPLSGISPFNPPTSRAGEIDPRANIAIARTNYLHGQYPIKNDDMLYTLSLFVTEPIRFAHEYGWRDLSELECQATFMFWREIGLRMKIEGIPDTLAAFMDWAQGYEEVHMVPATTNEVIATPNIEILISIFPDVLGLRTFARKATITVIPERVRIAMLQPSQPRYMHLLLDSGIAAFRFLQLHLSLPRSTPHHFVERDIWKLCAGGRYPSHEYPRQWQGQPWYKPKPTTTIGWLWERFLLLIGRHTELPSEQLRCQGYVLEQMGPLRFEKDGQQSARAEAEKLLGRDIPDAWVDRIAEPQ